MTERLVPGRAFGMRECASAGASRSGVTGGGAVRRGGLRAGGGGAALRPAGGADGGSEMVRDRARSRSRRMVLFMYSFWPTDVLSHIEFPAK